MDYTKSKTLISDKWAKVRIRSTPDPEIDKFIESPVVSIRYAFVTQILGKLTDSSRDILALQVAAGEGWDARSFAKHVVVPWVSENHNVLGRSPDPYVNNPLRRKRLDGEYGLQNRQLWVDLAEILRPLNNASQKEIEVIFDRCLESIARMGQKHVINYEFPDMISLDRLCTMVETFVETPSGGFRPLSICSALIKTLNKELHLFDKISVQGINESDARSNAVGDITCTNNKRVLVIEVKDRDLVIQDCHNTISKINDEQNTTVLFIAPAIYDKDKHNMRSYKMKNFMNGVSIHHADIVSLVRYTCMLMSDHMRLNLIKQIAEELEDGKYEDRADWNIQCKST